MEISDHALIRFIERVKGVSLEAYREEIRRVAAAAQWETTDRIPRRRVGLVFEGERVVTILTPGMKPKSGWDAANRRVVLGDAETLAGATTSRRRASGRLRRIVATAFALVALASLVAIMMSAEPAMFSDVLRWLRALAQRV